MVSCPSAVLIRRYVRDCRGWLSQADKRCLLPSLLGEILTGGCDALAGLVMMWKISSEMDSGSISNAGLGLDGAPYWGSRNMGAGSVSASEGWLSKGMRKMGLVEERLALDGL